MLRFFAEDAARTATACCSSISARDLTLAPMPEPLLAPLEDRAWQVLWSSEQPAYGGGGTPPLYRDGVLHIPGESALVLEPGPLTPEAAPELHADKQADRAAGRRDDE